MAADRPPPGTSAAPPSGPPEALPVGQMFDQFRVVGLLGRGGMGVVYEAEDTLLRRRVAIKTLSPTHGSEAALAGLLREARAAAQLDHPHVLRVLHIGRWPGGYYLVLELVRGGTLQARAGPGRPLPWPEATRAVADACRGLAAAHAVGLIHRDIKPANLMCDADGRVKVADFGLVRGGELTATSASHVAGTPQFMSPEQCRGDPLDGRADLYALGATYFFLLTGRVPYVQATPVQVMFAHCNNPVPDPCADTPGLPDAVVAVVRKAMAKEPANRYQTAAAMLDALLALTASEADATRSHAALPPLPTAWRPRRRLVVGLLGVSVLAAATGGAVVIATSRSPRRQSVDDDGPDPPIDPAIATGGRVVREFRLAGPVRALAFTPDGRRFAAGAAAPPNRRTSSPDGAVVWELPGGAEVVRLWAGRDVLCLTFKNAGKDLSLGGSNGAMDWNFPARKEFPCTEKQYGTIGALAVSPTDSRIAAGFAAGMCRGQSDEWAVNGGGTTRKLGQHQGWPGVRQLAYDDRDTLAAAFANGEVRAWLAGTKQPLPTIRQADGQPVAIAFARQGGILALAAGGEVRFRRPRVEASKADAPAPAWFTRVLRTPGPACAVAFAGHDRYLVTAGPGPDVLLWRLSVGQAVHRFPGDPDSRILGLALAPGDRLLATGDDQGKIRLWDLESVLKPLENGR